MTGGGAVKAVEGRYTQGMADSEILFLVEDAEEGGYIARALSHSIFAEGGNLDDLRKAVRDAVACHFPDEASRPRYIRLHYVRDEVIAA